MIVALGWEECAADSFSWRVDFGYAPGKNQSDRFKIHCFIKEDVLSFCKEHDIMLVKGWTAIFVTTEVEAMLVGMRFR